VYDVWRELKEAAKDGTSSSKKQLNRAEAEVVVRRLLQKFRVEAPSEAREFLISELLQMTGSGNGISE
jgi:hypothetical protein